MKVAPLPPDETNRLTALREYEVLDTPEEVVFDEIAKLASQICATPISLISLIDEKRQWFKARRGMADRESPRDVAFCAHAILDNQLLEVSDVTQDERFYDNPLVTGDPNIRFYAGMPLETPSGHRLGTLCVIDRKPRQLDEHQRFALQVLSQQVVLQLELRHKNRKVSQQLAIAETQKEALEQLNQVQVRILSVLSHDVKAPLQNLEGLMEMMGQGDVSPTEFGAFVPKIQQTLRSANGLLENLLQWAIAHAQDRTASPTEEVDLHRLVDQKIQEVLYLADQKSNQLVNEVPLGLTVRGDRNMIGAVLRNLVHNAIKFTQQGSIRIGAAAIAEGGVQLSVADEGVGMSLAQQAQLFDWQQRRSDRGTQNERGAGVGLLIARDLVKRHHGRMWVESQPGKGTTFFFTLRCPHAAS